MYDVQMIEFLIPSKSKIAKMNIKHMTKRVNFPSKRRFSKTDCVAYKLGKNR